MTRHFFLVTALLGLSLVYVALAGPGQPSCVPVEPEEPDCQAVETCRNGIDDDCDGLVDEGCACYAAADCPATETCVITDDCCPPAWCEPGMDCPAVCVPCGECRPAEPTACTEPCDCYAAGLEFTDPCPMMCMTCDNFWTCMEGFCVENCGPVPPEIAACR